MAKQYPKIRSEDATLDAMLAGASIARFGDGEWRCAIGGGCTSQSADPGLARELRLVLTEPQTEKYIVGLPNPFGGCPREVSWIKYTQAPFLGLIGAGEYYSSFISRPDNAPWIDRPVYWARVRELWLGQDVILVTGDEKSVTAAMIGGQAKSLREVHGPRQHAYAEIDRIETEIYSHIAHTGTRTRVLICLGAAATVLAWRLARRGVHALDLGHLGMFMRHAGAYGYSLDEVASPYYRAQLIELHRRQSWGNAGKSHKDPIERLAVEISAATILDYGCGTGSLAAAMLPRRVSGYDPGIPGCSGMPKPCELVVCTDVLEHIEPDPIDAVLDHIFRLTGKAAYFVIATRPAKAILPDGRNAHICLHDAPWWLEQLRALGWVLEVQQATKALTVIARKKP